MLHRGTDPSQRRQYCEQQAGRVVQPIGNGQYHGDERHQRADDPQRRVRLGTGRTKTEAVHHETAGRLPCDDRDREHGDADHRDGDGLRHDQVGPGETTDALPPAERALPVGRDTDGPPDLRQGPADPRYHGASDQQDDQTGTEGDQRGGDPVAEPATEFAVEPGLDREEHADAESRRQPDELMLLGGPGRAGGDRCHPPIMTVRDHAPDTGPGIERQERRISATYIASVPCTCGQSCTSGPFPSAGTPGSSGRTSSSAASVRRARTASTTEPASRGCGVHVTYATTPPGRTDVIAESSSRSCKGRSSSTSSGVRRQRASGRRRNAPRPLHGTSASTRSNEPSGQVGFVPSPTRTWWSPGTARRFDLTSSARCGCGSTAVSTPSRWLTIAASSADFPPGPAHRSSHLASEPSSGAEASATATSCDPSYCTPARPDETAEIRPGSPPPCSTAAYGDHRPRVAPASTSSSRSARPGRATNVTRGGSLSASSSSSNSSPSVPRASAKVSTIQRGWALAIAR